MLDFLSLPWSPFVVLAKPFLLHVKFHKLASDYDVVAIIEDYSDGC